LRSSANWDQDLAVSATFCPQTHHTKAIVYGCTEEMQTRLQNRLSQLEHELHPLVIPVLVAELERDRHINQFNKYNSTLMSKIMRMSQASFHLADINDNAVVETSQLWAQICQLRTGLQSWRAELLKMLEHAECLGKTHFKAPRPVENPSGHPSGPPTPPSEEDAARIAALQRLQHAGEMVKFKIREVVGEYDEKITECGTVIDGMKLAAQLVSSSHSYDFYFYDSYSYDGSTPFHVCRGPKPLKY
jgi:hypothetical protein